MLSEDYRLRFGGLERLYGAAAQQRIAGTHVLVAGLGGVGSWAAEALVRTGVGRLTLVDLDEVSITNTNRQLHTLETTLGLPKTEVMARRLREVNPELELQVVDDFLTPDNLPRYLTSELHGVLDAIDSIRTKTALLAWCKRHKLPVVTTGGAGGQLDPGQVQVADLARVTQDPLLAKVRQQLRRDYGFTRNPKRRFGLDCIYSTEQLRYPATGGTVSFAKPGVANTDLDCASGFGASMMVTASFGMQAASRLLQRVVKPETPAS